VPKVMAHAGTPALIEGLRGYAPNLRLVDRMRAWDVCDLMPAIAMTMLERWDQLGAPLARMDEFGHAGGRLAAAAAAAIREEQEAARGGPPPAHHQLRKLGYAGISELISFRPRSS